jgi:hypothetical protein
VGRRDKGLSGFQDGENTMKTITITATVLAALGIATVATIWSGAADRALADPQASSQAVMPIDVLTANARDLPMQSFDAF